MIKGRLFSRFLHFYCLIILHASIFQWRCVNFGHEIVLSLLRLIKAAWEISCTSCVSSPHMCFRVMKQKQIRILSCWQLHSQEWVWTDGVSVWLGKWRMTRTHCSPPAVCFPSTEAQWSDSESLTQSGWLHVDNRVHRGAHAFVFFNMLTKLQTSFLPLLRKYYMKDNRGSVCTGLSINVCLDEAVSIKYLSLQIKLQLGSVSLCCLNELCVCVRVCRWVGVCVSFSDTTPFSTNCIPSQWETFKTITFKFSLLVYI